MYTIGYVVIIALVTAWIFNPYKTFKPATKQSVGCVEKWTTRERSHGYPYYWKLRFMPDCFKQNKYWSGYDDDNYTDPLNRFPIHVPKHVVSNVIIIP